MHPNYRLKSGRQMPFDLQFIQISDAPGLNIGQVHSSDPDSTSFAYYNIQKVVCSSEPINVWLSCHGHVLFC